MASRIDRKNKKIGRLYVIDVSHFLKQEKRVTLFWKCICDCGNIVIVSSSNLNRQKSCGCTRKPKYKTGYTGKNGKKTKEYNTWAHIKARCYCETNAKYPIYGGRGITVCDRWIESFDNFLLDMGESPSKYHSIERKDVNGNYEPNNCKWATAKEQSNNTRRNVKIEYKGFNLTLVQWAEKLKYNYKHFHAQFRYKNKTIEQLSKGRL